MSRWDVNNYDDDKDVDNHSASISFFEVESEMTTNCFLTLPF